MYTSTDVITTPVLSLFPVFQIPTWRMIVICYAVQWGINITHTPAVYVHFNTRVLCYTVGELLRPQYMHE